MLEMLFGSKNIQKILIFLFVNGKCYGAQLQRTLDTALTPLQKALQRLEKGEVISSYYEGKTRVYIFNPAFPLLEELEMLLKKAYTLLPPKEKIIFSTINEGGFKPGASHLKEKQTLMNFWEKLEKIKRLTFNAVTKSREENGWKGKGKGEVFVSKEGENTLIFTEKGTWKGTSGKEMDFSNVFRWTIDRAVGMISLEHLRRGVHHPVFLFYLAPSGKNTLSSIDSHLCEGDAYFGKIFYDNQYLRLNWRVIGNKKNEEIDYYYT